MSSPRRDRDRLRDIVEAAERALGYAAGLTFESFLDDTRTQDAILRNLQFTGEATKKVSPVLRARILTSPGGRWPVCVTASCMITSA
jgi:uncharacterized protein with HEPN domain